MCCISEYNNHAECWLVFGLILPVLFLLGVCAATFWLQSSQWQSNSMQRGGTCFQKGWYPTDCQQRRPKLVAGMIIVVFTDLFWLICIGQLYFTDNIVLSDRHAIWWKEVLGWFPASFWKKRGKHLFLKTLMEQVIHLKHTTVAKTWNTMTYHINVLCFCSINKYLGENYGTFLYVMHSNWFVFCICKFVFSLGLHY